MMMRMKRTVKTLVGVDLLGSYESSVELCKRIKFENQEWVFVHALPVLPWYVPGMFPQVIPVAETVDALNDSGRLALTKARKLVGDYRSTDHMQEGDAATMLTNFAQDEDADLIVMGSGHPRTVRFGSWEVSPERYRSKRNSLYWWQNCRLQKADQFTPCLLPTIRNMQTAHWINSFLGIPRGFRELML